MASSQDRVAKLLLRIETEKQNIQRAKQQITAFEGDLRKFKVQTELVNLGMEKQVLVLQRQKIAAAQAEQATTKLAQAENQVQREVEETTSAIQRLSSVRDEANKKFLAQSAEPSAASILGGGGGDPRAGASRLQAFGREARLSVPAFPIPGTGLSTEFGFRVAEIAGRLGVSLKGLAVAGTAAVGSMVAIGLALDNFKNTIKAVENVLRGVTEARIEVAGQLVTATRESLQAEVERLKINRDILEAQSRQALQDRITLGRALNEQGIIGQLIGGIGGAFGSGPIGEADARFNDLNAQLAAANVQISAYTDALNQNATAANDATEAAKKRAEAIQQELDNANRQRLNLQREFAGSADIEGLDRRIEGLRAERDVLADFLQDQTLSTELTRELHLEYVNLNREINILSGSIREEVAARARASELFNNIRDGIANFVEETKRRFEEFQEAARRVTELQEQFTLRLVDIERRRQQAIEDAAFTRDQDIVRARRDSAIAEAEAVRKAGLERAEIERETQRNIARIISRSRFDIENAIQDRDAVALDLARRRRDEEVRSEQDNRSERLRELDNGLKEEIRTIRRRLSQQILTIDERYAEQVRRANLAAQRSIEVETEKFQRELAIRAAALRQVLGIEQRGAQQEVNIAARGAQANLNIQGKFWQNSIALAQRAVQSITSQGARVQQFRGGGASAGGGGRSFGFAPSLQTGGRIMSDGLVFAHAGEMIVNPRRGQSPGVNINVEGLNRREIHRVLDKALDDYTLENF